MAGIARFILLHKTVDEKILYVSIHIPKICPRVRHELEGLECRGIDHILGNNVARKHLWRGQDRGTISGGGARLHLASGQDELLIDVGLAHGGKTKLLRDTCRQPTAAGPDKVAEVSVAHRIGGKQRSYAQKILTPARFVGKKEKRSIMPIVELWDHDWSTHG